MSLRCMERDSPLLQARRTSLNNKLFLWCRTPVGGLTLCQKDSPINARRSRQAHVISDQPVRITNQQRPHHVLRVVVLHCDNPCILTSCAYRPVALPRKPSAVENRAFAPAWLNGRLQLGVSLITIGYQPYSLQCLRMRTWRMHHLNLFLPKKQLQNVQDYLCCSRQREAGQGHERCI